ncbi:ABC transporter ATP-binding protein [Marinicellulosiphila megalodicopiae]|uniref:ABC transporter ATP-binding protein n=1 Tax=Marinicellulosiphila megalodicopiae TaxID=2724896 RepID=UPI003BB1A668
MASISFKNVVKSYGDVNIIKGLDLEIADKEFVVLVGPSGCGKSTTLRMIAGLEDITSGKLLIGDRVVNNVHPKERDVAMVFQSYALYPHMTVAENIAFGLKLRKMPKAEIKKLVDDAADNLGLGHLLERKPKDLSGGQRQRVALGRAIVRKPSVFLFDEPLSNLDAELRVHMRAEIGKLQKRLGVTAVYVTHDQVEAMTMGDRICVLHKGELQQVGTPLELYDTPCNVFIGGFIGTPNMNFITIKVSDDGASFTSDVFSGQIPAAWAQAAAAKKGQDIIVGYRPEDVRAEDEQKCANRASFGGEIDIVETLGHEVVVYMNVPGHKEKITGKMDPHKVPRSGDKMTFALDLDKLHMFDSETKKRL